MRKITILLITGILFLFSCSKEKKTGNNPQKEQDSVNMQIQNRLDSIKNAGFEKVYISSIKKYVNISELQDDISPSREDYIGIYADDENKPAEETKNNWKELKVYKEVNDIFASITYYEQGKKKEEIRLVAFKFEKNVISGIIIKSKMKYRFEGRFVKYPYESEDSDAIYGFLSREENRYVFFELEN